MISPLWGSFLADDDGADPAIAARRVAVPDPNAPKVMRMNSIALRVSREMALDYGLVDPTPEEAAALAAERAEWERRRAEAWTVYLAACAKLDRIAELTDPVVKLVLDLHAPHQLEAPKCDGCNVDGYDAEQPDWPCSTVRAIAEHGGIDLPDPYVSLRAPLDL